MEPVLPRMARRRRVSGMRCCPRVISLSRRGAGWDGSSGGLLVGTPPCRLSPASRPIIPQVIGWAMSGPACARPPHHASTPSSDLLGRHANGAIEADDLAVEHGVLDDVPR